MYTPGASLWNDSTKCRKTKAEYIMPLCVWNSQINNMQNTEYCHLCFMHLAVYFCTVFVKKCNLDKLFSCTNLNTWQHITTVGSDDDISPAQNYMNKQKMLLSHIYYVTIQSVTDGKPSNRFGQRQTKNLFHLTQTRKATQPKGAANDASSRAPNINFSLLWPWTLTSWPHSRSFHVLAPWTTCAVCIKTGSFVIIKISYSQVW